MRLAGFCLLALTLAGAAAAAEFGAPELPPSIDVPALPTPLVAVPAAAVPELPAMPVLPVLPAAAAAAAPAAVAPAATEAQPLSGAIRAAASMSSSDARAETARDLSADFGRIADGSRGGSDSAVPVEAPAASYTKLHDFLPAQDNPRHPIPATSVLALTTAGRDTTWAMIQSLTQRVGTSPGIMTLDDGRQYLEFRAASAGQAQALAEALARLPEITGVYLSPSARR